VVPDEVWMLVENTDDFPSELRGHVLCRRIEPDHRRELAVVGEEFLHLRNGLGMQVLGKVAVLRFVPVVRYRVMVAAQSGRSTGRSPVLILRVVEAELDALL